MTIPFQDSPSLILPRGTDPTLHGLNENHDQEHAPTNTSNYDLSYYFQQQQQSPTFQQEELPKGFYRRTRSLSIGSTISTSQQQYAPPPSDDTKNLRYKLKTDKSNQKAHQFFGEQVKLEISAREIKREGLRALLLSTVPLGYFLYHLLNEYSSENLFFYLAVENYQNYEFSSHSERLHVANKIAKAYLTRNSELEINLEDKIYRTVIKSLEQLQHQESIAGIEFDAAKKHVFSLLNASYYRFRTTNIWNIMESKCSDMNAFNRERSQALVINLLLSHMRCKNRDSTTYKLVHSFCRIYLPYGYQLQLSGNRIDTSPMNCRKAAGGNETKKGNGFIKFDLFRLSRK
ncbi:hypothetical protein CU098_012777 [Rhizopus stolonifer]|uniref:RGS domain-containing protein n=1 Tax=Rhizopus stolonifer TaxID=4846 RepID=A0A367KPG4_RHIST|nr:hypothetical protein CU098_012777 [Rhizopus stolonifer]